MKLDLTVIKNESILKLEKAHKNVKNKFEDMLFIALDAVVHEIDSEKRQEIEVILGDLLNDEFNKYKLAYTKCMNKAAELVENGLC